MWENRLNRTSRKVFSGIVPLTGFPDLSFAHSGKKKEEEEKGGEDWKVESLVVLIFYSYREKQVEFDIICNMSPGKRGRAS